MKKYLILTLSLAAWCRVQAALPIPAFTAYLDPFDGDGQVSEDNGITGWTDPAQKVLWFGDFKNTGDVDCSVTVQLAAGAASQLRLTVNGTAHTVTVQGQGDSPTNVDFGAFKISDTGYQRFTLESLNAAGKDAGNIQTLTVDGPAAADAHFNLKSRRNAASVHLAYPTSGYTNIDVFYVEVTAVTDPIWSYYQACGWHRGYFGMQVNSPTERRIIFSVWDSGHEPTDRSKVAATDRVTLMGKGDGVYAGDFGNEGTGGHSHLIYNWKTGQKQRFLVTARPVDPQCTIYSGYYFHPDKKQWMLIASWRAPHDGEFMHGLYSFNEDFVGDNGYLRRKALFGNQWLRTADGQWHEQTVATFSHDATGRADRLDRFMGVEDGQFFLSNGGFVPGYTKFGKKFTRPATDHPPTDFPAAWLPEANQKS